MVVLNHLADQKMSTRQSGPVAQWIGETISIQIVDERSPITVSLRDSTTGKDIMSVAYTLAQLRSIPSTVNTLISNNGSGPIVMARFEVAENDMQRLEFEIRER